MNLRALAFLVLLPAAAPAATSPFRDIFFEPNRGQADRNIAFVSRTQGGGAGFTSSGPVFRFGDATVRLSLAGVNSAASFEPLDLQRDETSYITGAERSGWLLNVPHYRRLAWRNVYPGIDVLFYGAEGKLEYDFVVAPGGDPSAIRIDFDGVARASLTREGDLLFRHGKSKLEMHRPMLYQTLASGERQEIAGRYRLADDGRSLRFEVAAYDLAKALVVDPVLTFSSMVGGEKDDSIAAVTSLGDIVGTTTSLGFGSEERRGRDVFAYMMRTTSYSSIPIQTLFILSGSGDDVATCASAGSRTLLIGGWTTSSDLLRKETRRGADGFLIAIDRGSQQFSSMGIVTLGGSGDDRITALIGSASVYFIGETDSPDLTLGGKPLESKWAGGKDAFAGIGYAIYSQISLSALAYFGGSGDDAGSAVILDPRNGIMIAGQTSSKDLPLARPVKSELSGPSDGFLARFISLNGTAAPALDFATYFGGSGADEIRGLANPGTKYLPALVYFAGTTSSTDLPATGPGQNSFGGGETDGFVGQLDFAKSSLAWLNYIGGSGRDVVAALGTRSIVYMGDQEPLVLGSTTSPDFPVIDPVQAQLAGAQDAFLARLTPNGKTVFATYFGGSAADRGNALTVAADGVVTIGGESESPDLPALPRGVPIVYSGGIDGFTASFSMPYFAAGPTVWTGPDITATATFTLSTEVSSTALVTIASSDPSRVLVGGSTTGANKASLTVPLGSLFRSSIGVVFYITGIADSGSASVTITVAGAGQQTLDVRFAPEVIGVSLSSAESGTSMYVDQYRYVSAGVGVVDDAGVLRYGNRRAGLPALKVPIALSDPAVGVLSSNTLVIQPADRYNSEQVTFTAKQPGQTEITASSGDLPVRRSNALEITVVNIEFSVSDFSIGKGLQRALPVASKPYESIQRNEITFTSDDPSRLCFKDSSGKSCVASVSTASPVSAIAVALADSGTVKISYSSAKLGSGSAVAQLTRPRIFLRTGNTSGGMFTMLEGATTDLYVSFGSVADSDPTSALAGDTLPGLQITSSNPKVITVTDVALSKSTLKALGVGQAVLSAAAPGFDAGFLNATVAPQEAPVPVVSTSNLTVGRDLRAPIAIRLPISTTATVKIASSDPRLALVSALGSETPAPEASQTGTSTFSFYVHALAAAGTVRLTFSSAGYSDIVVPVRLVPSGFAWNVPAIAVMSYSTVAVEGSWYALDPISLAPMFPQFLRSGVSAAPNISVSDPDAGKLVKNSNSALMFSAARPGLTSIVIEQPAGFTQPRLRTALQVNVNPVSVTWIGTAFVGQDLQNGVTIASGVVATLTVRSDDPSRLLLSSDPRAPGAGAVEIQSGAKIYLQALASDGVVYVRVSGNNIEESAFPVILTKSVAVLSVPYGSSSMPVRTTTQSPDLGFEVRLVADSEYASTENALRAGASVVEAEVVSSNEQVARPLSSRVSIRPGETATATFKIRAVAPGDAVIRVLPPAQFATGEAVRAIPVKVAQPSFAFEAMKIGRDLVVSREMRIESGVSLPSTVIVTLTSSDPSKVLLAQRSDQPGQSKLSLPYSGNSSTTFYMHGVADGSCTITASASGLDDSSFTATVGPPSITLNKTDLVYTRSSPELYLSFNAPVRPGARFTIPVRSSDPAVASVESPVTITEGQVSGKLKITGVRPGTAVISMDLPEGIVANGPSNFTLTVEDPPVPVSFTSRSFSIGKDLQLWPFMDLKAAVTLSSSDPSKLLISTDPKAAGRASVTLEDAQYRPSVYFQALSDSGSATVTFSAPGFKDVVVTINFCPSGFQFNGAVASVSMTRTADLEIRPATLCSTPDYTSDPRSIRGGLGPLTVAVSIDKPAVGTLKPSSVVFAAGSDRGVATFTPAGLGSAIVSLTPPAGFVTPIQYGQLVVTVVP